MILQQNSHPNLLQVKGLCVEAATFPSTKTILNNISFDIKPEENFALIGESGSGKTMTALALLGLLPNGLKITGGTIKFYGETVRSNGSFTYKDLRGKRIAMIFQEPVAALNPVFTIGSQIKDIIQTHLQLSKQKAQSYALQILKDMGLDNTDFIMKSYPFRLSGGMAQRVMIAMALSCRPQLLIADEPTTALDATTQIQILRLLSHLQQKFSFSILFITHDLTLVNAMAKRIAVMYNGQIIETGNVEDVINNPKHEYTQELVKAVIT